MNLLPDRVAMSSPILPEGVGTWLDIYDTEFEPWGEEPLDDE